MNCRRLNNNDISEVTRVHLKAFADFFLTKLGESFLLLYYKSLINNNTGFGFGVFNDEGRLLGFSVATTCPRGFNRNLIINNFVPFLIAGIRLLLTKPKSLVRLYRNLSKNGFKDDDCDYAELYSIAVDPEMQGKGVGKILLRNTENEALRAGCQRMTLTTDFYRCS
jgi:ribosomal protein S18 acetylase RimI-like enzyme